MIIYRATNKINGKQYIGYTTKSLSERIQTHVNKSKSNSDKSYFYLFKLALRKYEIDNFEWDILETCTSKEECCKREIYYIDKYNTISPNGYNLTYGGNGGIMSKETKEKVSKSLKTYWQNNDHYWTDVSSETRSEWAKKSWMTKKEKGYIKPGYIHSEESKVKMSVTKNSKNKIKWFNSVTKEVVELSLTEMSKKTGLSTGTFNHLHKNRSITTKCGWKIFKQ